MPFFNANIQLDNKDITKTLSNNINTSQNEPILFHRMSLIYLSDLEMYADFQLNFLYEFVDLMSYRVSWSLIQSNINIIESGYWTVDIYTRIIYNEGGFNWLDEGDLTPLWIHPEAVIGSTALI